MSLWPRMASPAARLVLLLLAVSAPVLNAATTSLTMTSDPGDPLGGGSTFSYTPADGSFVAPRTFGNGVEISFSSSTSWFLYFAPPAGQALTPGIYEGATRWPFQSPTAPGLSVFGPTGCNSLTGRFVVLDAQYGPSNEVLSFAADFEQHCEGVEPALFGSVRYNSDVSHGPRISAASAATYEGDGELKSLAFWLSLSARAADAVTVDYATVDDTAKAGIDYIPVSGTATFPAGQTSVRVDVPALGNTFPQPDRSLLLALANPAGAPVAFGQAAGRILDDDSARTFMHFESDPGDYIGGGRTFTLTPLDGTFSAQAVASRVDVSFQGSASSGAVFTAPPGTLLTPGIYEGAQGLFRSPLAPGLSASVENRACGTVAGRFVVLEVVYGPSNEVLSFAADFEQHCDGASPALFGSIRYNSTVGLGSRISVGSAVTYEGDGEPKNLSFWLSLSARSNASVTVDYSTLDDTAKAGTDYVPVSGTATFPAGQTAVLVDVPVLGNTIPQADRRLFFSLSKPVGAPISSGQATGTILDDDTTRTFLAFDSDPGDFIGQGRKFTLTPLDGTFLAVGAEVRVTVTFNGLEAWFLQFAPPTGIPLTPGIYEGATGAQSSTAPNLSIYGDGRGCNTVTGRFIVFEAVYGPGEVVKSFAADFEQHCDGMGPALHGSIRYNSLIGVAPRISVGPASTFEGDGEPRSLTFFVSLSAPARVPVSVGYSTVDDTAKAGMDYTAITGTANFPVGQTAVRVDVPVLGNTIVQPDRKLFLALSNPVGAAVAIGQATGTILDDDAGRTFLYLYGEGLGGPPRTFTTLDGTFTATGSTNGVFVNFNGATGFWDLSFVPPSGVPLAPGIYEGATRYPFQSPTTPGLDGGAGCNTLTGRFVVLEASYDPSGAVQSLAIDFEQHCEGAAPALLGSVRFNSLVGLGPRVSVASAATLEGDGEPKNLTFWLSLSARSSSPVTIDYATVDDTAKADIDYSAVSGTATFPAGQTAIRLDVPVLGNRIAQSNRRLFLALSNPTGAPIAFGRATGTILDDDVSRALITLDSEAGDWVGQGQKLTLTPVDGTITVAGSTGGLGANFHGASDWDLHFAPVTGGSLGPGAYEGAARFESRNSPGLDVFGQGRGCNIVAGRFVVLEANYGSGTEVQAFAADFEQHCEGGAPALFGSVRYNSTIPVTPRATKAGFFPLTPCRLIDTRETPGALHAGIPRTFAVAGRCGIPPTARSLIVNVTVVSPTDPGDVRLYRTGFSAVANGLIPFAAGRTRANNAFIQVEEGDFTIQCVMPGNANGTAHVVVDVSGYFQ